MLPSATISSQALGDVANLMRRKLGFTPQQAAEVVADLSGRMDVVLVGTRTILMALDLAPRHSLSHFDSQIVASALQSGCEVRYSEDMHAGQVFDGRLQIVNPFAAPLR